MFILFLNKIINYFFIVFLFIFSACNLKIFSKVKLDEVTIVSSSKLSEVGVVQVHLLIPKTKELFSDLLKLDSFAYFTVAEELIQSNPDTLDAFKFEVAPGQKINEKIVTRNISGVGVVVFAKYNTDPLKRKAGIHRVTVPNLKKKVRISLENDTLHLR